MRNMFRRFNLHLAVLHVVGALFFLGFNGSRASGRTDFLSTFFSRMFVAVYGPSRAVSPGVTESAPGPVRKDQTVAPTKSRYTGIFSAEPQDTSTVKDPGANPPPPPPPR